MEAQARQKLLWKMFSDSYFPISSSLNDSNSGLNAIAGLVDMSVYVCLAKT